MKKELKVSKSFKVGLMILLLAEMGLIYCGASASLTLFSFDSILFSYVLIVLTITIFSAVMLFFGGITILKEII